MHGTAQHATRTQRIRAIVAFALHVADSADVAPTSCGAEVARDGRWSSLNMWFDTADDMHRFVAALVAVDDGEHTEQGEGQRHLRGWSRDAYNAAPLLDGEPRMYVRLNSHDEQPAGVTA